MERGNETTLAPDAFDIERYRHHIAHLGLPRERETEMIQTLRVFLGGFVDRAFGQDSIRLAAGDRLQLSGESRNPAVLGSDPVPENHSDLTDTFAQANGPDQRKR